MLRKRFSTGGSLCDQRISTLKSTIGSGASPIRSVSIGRGSGTMLKGLAAAFRNLPVPVIGRIEGGALVLDLRCLEHGDETAFVAQLAKLSPSAMPAK